MMGEARRAGHASHNNNSSERAKSPARAPVSGMERMEAGKHHTRCDSERLQTREKLIFKFHWQRASGVDWKECDADDVKKPKLMEIRCTAM
eukprot:2268284-Rhodomonas_salina.3